MARSLVALNAQGRLTLPANARRKLGLREGSQLEVEVDDDRITLRPMKLVVAEDAWAYSQEHLESVRRAIADLRAGRTYQLSGEQLSRGGRRQGGRSQKQERPPARTAR